MIFSASFYILKLNPIFYFFSVLKRPLHWTIYFLNIYADLFFINYLNLQADVYLMFIATKNHYKSL